MDFDLELTGFTEDEIAGIIKLGTEEEYEDEFDIEEALPEEAVTKPGDIWQLGEHILACGDSTNSEDMKRLVDGRVADLIVTDPPYNVAYEGKTKDKLKIQNDHQSTDDFTAFLEAAFKNMAEWLKPGGGGLHMARRHDEKSFFRCNSADRLIGTRGACVGQEHNGFRKAGLSLAT